MRRRTLVGLLSLLAMLNWSAATGYTQTAVYRVSDDEDAAVTNYTPLDQIGRYTDLVSHEQAEAEYASLSGLVGGEAGCAAKDACGCDGGCKGSCGKGGRGSGLFGDCCLGEPWEFMPRHCNGFKIGGWVQAGFTTYNNSKFNNRPDQVNLNQAWIYLDKEADGSQGLDWGFRADYVYGTDGPDTQAFGGAPTSWDNQWDDGMGNLGYGRALPQLYAEVAYGDLSVRAGHFFTIIGYEVVPAPDNFFYSHAFTMFNAEPFTHTGALATYAMSDNVEVYGGWVQGWDTGFSSNGGDAFLGGLSLTLTENASVTYALTAGTRARGDKGYGHSVVFDVALSDRLQWICQNDFNTYTNLKTLGVNNYFFYTINDCLALGTRMEWWRRKSAAGNNSDLYELTAGLNIRPCANMVLRPEIRWDWDKDGVLINPGDNNKLGFGIDVVTTW